MEGKCPTPSERGEFSAKTKLFFGEWKRLQLIDNTLFRAIKDPKTLEERRQLVLPECLPEDV